MSWGKTRGHDRVVASLRQALRLGRFPHALLFTGPEGIGKRLVAQRMAQAFLCERHDELEFEPCGECPSCVQVVGGTHPDVLTVRRPEERHELPIDAIRQLNHDLALAPMRGRRRIAIVDDADDLSEEAANAFLKSLEEPPPGSILILIGTAPELQLDTILSRCRVVRFDPLAEQDLAQILLDQQLTPDLETALALAARSEGSVSRARGLADPELGPFRRDLLDTVAHPQGFDAPGLARRMEAFANEAGKESAARRERASLVVGELARFFRAVLWELSGLTTPGTDPDDRRAASRLGEQVTPEATFQLLERCLEAEYHITRKAYLPLVFEGLTHDLEALMRRHSHG